MYFVGMFSTEGGDGDGDVGCYRGGKSKKKYKENYILKHNR